MVRLALTLLLATMIALAAFVYLSLERDPAIEPPPSGTTPPGTPASTTTPAPAATASPTVPAPPALATTEPAGNADIETATESTDEPYAYSARYPAIPDLPLIADTLSRAIIDERARFEVEHGPFDRAAPVAGVSFDVSFDILVASADVFGVHLHFEESVDGDTFAGSTVFWFDLTANEAHPATALVGAGDDLQAVVALIRDAVLEGYRQVIVPDDLQRVLSAPEQNLRTVGFTEEGDLLVLFDHGSIGPALLGRLGVVLPAPQVEPHLSDLGRRVRAETLNSSAPLDVSTTDEGGT